MSEQDEYFKARNEALERLIEGVNQEQIGGEHYKLAKFQHWDFVIANKLGYFEGQITKYVCRWRDKGGVNDLKKSVHYLAKLISAIRAGNLPLPQPRGEVSNLADLHNSYPQMSITELGILRTMSIYTTEQQLYQAGELIQGLLEHYRRTGL